MKLLWMTLISIQFIGCILSPEDSVGTTANSVQQQIQTKPAQKLGNPDQDYSFTLGVSCFGCQQMFMAGPVYQITYENNELIIVSMYNPSHPELLSELPPYFNEIVVPTLENITSFAESVKDRGFYQHHIEYDEEHITIPSRIFIDKNEDIVGDEIQITLSDITLY